MSREISMLCEDGFNILRNPKIDSATKNNKVFDVLKKISESNRRKKVKLK